jgi:hypothetical protein
VTIAPRRSHLAGRLTLALALALAASGPALRAAAEPPPPPPPARAFDWCSGIAVRPDSRQQKVGQTCLPAWSDLEIASGADFVWIGATGDTEKPGPATHPADSCGWPATHRDNAAYVARLRGRRAAQGGPPLRVIHLHRFDLVTDSLAAEPGFRADFLVRTKRPWNEVLAFFAADRSPACGRGGCRFTHAWGGWEDRNQGAWLADWIRRAGGNPDEHVYYLIRAAQVTDRFSPVAALADLGNPAYRAWRVALAKRAVEVGDYDAVLLNQKFHQYAAPHWIGSPNLPDAAALRAQGDDTFWTAPPDGYDGRAYVAGWAALGRELAQAGVPYAVDLPGWPGPTAPVGPAGGSDAATRVRETARRARFVFLERHAWGDRPGLLAFAEDVAASGAEVVWMDTRCGFKRP